MLIIKPRPMKLKPNNEPNPMKLIKQPLRGFGVAAMSLLMTNLPIKADPAIADEAHAICVDAYLYFYPLVTMDITRKQLTNTEHAEGLQAPMNSFANIPAYPTADMRVV